jgi:AcrR family transcriptional regulator
VSTTLRPYHHGNLRSALLEHAERALAERGAGALSLRELAREIGVSHAAPQRHFADKQALLDALAESGFERLGERLQAAADAAGAGFEDRLKALARAYVGFAVEHGELLELMYAAKHGPEASERLRAAGEQAFAAPRALIAEGQASGEVVGGEPERVATAAWAMVHGIASMASSGMLDGATLSELVDDAVGWGILGLRPR